MICIHTFATSKDYVPVQLAIHSQNIIDVARISQIANLIQLDIVQHNSAFHIDYSIHNVDADSH